MLNDFVFCVLIRVYPMFPYPALYCDGPLCQLGLPQQAVTVSSEPLTKVTVLLRQFSPHLWYFPIRRLNFCYYACTKKWSLTLLLVFASHKGDYTLPNNHIPNPRTLLSRIQNEMMYTLVVLLMINVAGFGIFGTPSVKSTEITHVRSYVDCEIFNQFCVIAIRPVLARIKRWPNTHFWWYRKPRVF